MFPTVFIDESQVIYVEDCALISKINSSTNFNKFTYCSHNIAHNSLDVELDIVSYDGCKCGVLSCNPALCPCLLRFGENYNEDNTILMKQTPVFECNSVCLCGDACVNRKVQHGLKLPLLIFHCGANKVLGLKTLKPLKKGEFVCEYAGEVISTEEARMRTTQQKGMNYIITVMEHSIHDKTVTIIDPKDTGNIGRFINHSCSPNLVMIPVRCDSEVPMLALFTQKDIAANEELTFHYNGSGDKDSIGVKSMKKCFCKSDNCKGFLPFNEELF